jgi:hypothetical protein
LFYLWLPDVDKKSDDEMLNLARGEARVLASVAFKADSRRDD